MSMTGAKHKHPAGSEICLPDFYPVRKPPVPGIALKTGRGEKTRFKGILFQKSAYG
jgi:hypothetical protein